jgi:hypothetical protein
MPDGTLALSIPGLFLTCVQYFTLVQLGRNFTSDFGSSYLQLRAVELRFQRWGAAAGITDDNEQSHASMQQLAKQHSEKDVRLAFLTCNQIKTQLDTARGASEVYSLTTDNPEELDLCNALTELEVCGPKAKQADGALRKLKSRYDRTMQKTTRFVAASKWALFQKTQLEGLLSTIGEHITTLEKLFPQQERALAAEEAQALDRNDLEALAPLATNCDPYLASALQAEAPHKELVWENSVTMEKATAHYGNNYKKLPAHQVSQRWLNPRSGGNSVTHHGNNYEYDTVPVLQSAYGTGRDPFPPAVAGAVDWTRFANGPVFEMDGSWPGSGSLR